MELHIALRAFLPMMPPTMPHYRDYVGKVQKKRLRFVDRINLIVAVAVSVALILPYTNRWFNLMLTPVSVVLIFGGLWAVKLLRQYHLTTLYPQQKTLFGRIVVLALSSGKVLGYYILLSYAVALCLAWHIPAIWHYNLVSKLFRNRQYLNDETLFYSCYPLLMAILYAFIHMLAQRNRLDFNLGTTPKRDPRMFLSGFAKIMLNSIFFTIALAIIGWPTWQILRNIIYLVLKYPIILAGLDPGVPPVRLHFSTWLSMVFATFVTIISWEITNHAFNVYLTIGCIDGKTALSTNSSEPLICLVGGLQDEDEIVQAIAFQEIAYIASSPEAKHLRNIIYNRTPQRWPEIYDICLRIVGRYSDRVNYRSPQDSKALEKSAEKTIAVRKEASDPAKGSGRLFGNLESDKHQVSKNSTVKAYSELTTKATKNSKSGLGQRFQDIFQKHVKPLWTTVVKSTEKWHTHWEVKQFARMKQYTLKFYAWFLHLGVGIFFRIYVQQDAEVRVQVTNVVCNAAVALAELAIHAIAEDRLGTVSNRDICSVLNNLERPIRVLANYVDYIPALIYNADTEECRKQALDLVVADVHDVIIIEFRNVCNQYNYKFLSLVVNEQTQRLAERVLEIK